MRRPMKASDARDYAFAGSKYQPKPKAMVKGPSGDDVPSGFGRQSNMSPWSTEVHAMSEDELNAYCEQAWIGAQEEYMNATGRVFSYSWDAAMELAKSLNLLTYPRYIQYNKSGTWSVRDHSHKIPLSTADNGPLAVCRAVVILHYGKGRPHSTVQKD